MILHTFCRETSCFPPVVGGAFLSLKGARQTSAVECVASKSPLTVRQSSGRRDALCYSSTASCAAGVVLTEEATSTQPPEFWSRTTHSPKWYRKKNRKKRADELGFVLISCAAATTYNGGLRKLEDGVANCDASSTQNWASKAYKEFFVEFVGELGSQNFLDYA